MENIGKSWEDIHPIGPRIGIGDISNKDGSPFGGHASHQNGVDVDIRPMRNDKKEAGVNYKSNKYSQTLTQDLAKEINKDQNVKFTLFNDPNIKGVKPDKEGVHVHDNHSHIRFKK